MLRVASGTRWVKWQDGHAKADWLSVERGRRHQFAQMGSRSSA